MASIENPTSRENSDVEKQLQEQRRVAEQKEKSRPSESTQDVRSKEVFRIALPAIKDALGKQKQIMEKMIAEIKAKEFTFSSFANPENLMGFSTLQKGEGHIFGMQTGYNFQGKTNIGERLDTIEQFQSRSSILYTALLRLEYALSSGQRMEDIEKDRSMVSFFMSPEAKYMLALSGGLPVDTAMQEYNLHKAREIKKFIINGDILAESYYDELKGTPYEKEADKERMGMLEYARKKWVTDFGDTFLSLDQLGFLVAGGAIGKGVGATIAMSPKLAQLSVGAIEKLSNGVPGVITRIVPGVNVVKTQAGEGVATTLTKFCINFPLEIGKFAGYEALAKQFGGDDTAQIVAMLMMVMPGAREGFASSLRAKAAKDGNQIQSGELKGEFVKWIQVNYGEDKAKQMLYAGLVEAKAQTFKKIKSGYDTEVANTVETMMKNISGKTPEVKGVPTKIEQAIASISKSKKELGFDITKNPVYKEYSFLDKYADVLGDLKPSDIISDIGTQALIVKPKYLKGVIAKIERPDAVDKVKDEFTHHNEAYNLWRKGRKDGAIPENIYVPKVILPDGVDKGILLIEQVQGQSFHTKSLIENAYKIRKDAQPLTQVEKDIVSGLTDGDAKRYITSKYNISADEAFKVIELYSVDHLGPYLHDRMRPTFKTDLTKTLEYLARQVPGISQGDIHPGNFMITNDKKIYIIDWGRAKMTNVTNPTIP